MKKRKKQLGSRLPPVRVGIDDIQEILEILSELPGDQEISISTDKFEVDSTAELSQLRQESVTEVAISCMLRGLGELEWVRVGIYPTWVSLSSTTDSHEIAGAMFKIEQFLKGRQLNWLARFQHWYAVSIPIVIFSLFLFSYAAGSGDTQTKNAIYAVWASLLILWIFLAASKASRQSQILLTDRHEASTFWQRKKDDILLVIISFALGIIGTLTVQWLAKA